MDCKEFQEYVSAFVDNQIDEQKKHNAQEHIGICQSCFFDYKIETLAKKIVSNKFQKVTCPESLRIKILESLVYNKNFISQKSFKDQLIELIQNIFTKRKVRLSFAFGLILIFALLIFNPFKSSEEKFYQEFAASVYENCKNLRNHKFPAKTIFTTNPDQVAQFIFSNGIKNPVMPKTDWTVTVAGVEENNSCVLAHLLFKCEEDTVYMMQCEIDALRNTKYYDLFQKIHNDLKQKSFVKVDHGNCSIIFRLENDVLMTYAMSSHNHHAFEELIASLK